MKKQITLIIAMVMSICLLGFNSNAAKAQDDAYTIYNMNNLVEFFENRDYKVGNLASHIDFDDLNPITCAKEIHVHGDKTLNLNGYDINFSDCMLLTSSEQTNVTINGASGSEFIANNDAFLYAMIGTRLRNLTTKLSFTLDINNVTFDGNNKNDLIGLVAGYSSVNPLDPHPEGYYDNNPNIVNIEDCEFKNFNIDEEGIAAAGIINAGATVNIKNCDIYDNMIGVGTGHYNEITEKPTTNIINDGSAAKATNIYDNNIGVANGFDLNIDNPFGEEEPFVLDYKPGIINVSGVYGPEYNPVNILNNEIGIQLGNKGTEDDVNMHNIGLISFADNDKDYYLVGDAYLTPYGDGIGGSAFSVYLDSYPEYGEKREIIKESDMSGNFVYSNEQNIMTISGENGTIMYHPTDSERLNASSKSVVKGEKVTFTMNVGNVEYVSLVSPDGKYIQAEIKDGVAKITIPVEVEGNYRFDYYNKENERIISNVATIKIVEPQPTPTPKDESCEKVIGPTWHWNNKKGICEDTGVVKTYTR